MFLADYSLLLSISIVTFWSLAFMPMIHVQQTVWLLPLSILIVLVVEFVVIHDDLLSQLRVFFMIGLGLTRIAISVVSRSAVENLTNISTSLADLDLSQKRKTNSKNKGRDNSSSGLKVHRDFMPGQKERKQQKIY
jgi:hypothetical protein